jgi:hypothetical protein
MIPKMDSSKFIEIQQLITGVGVISKLAMIEQSSKAGDKTRKAVRRAFVSSSTKWVQEFVDGRRIIKKRPNYNSVLGKRFSQSSGNLADPSNMANFITSFTHKTTGTTVVGGTHPSHSPVKIENGKVTGRLPRQNGISKQTIAILEKLNYGANRKSEGRFSDKLRWNNGVDSMFDESTWKPRRFFEKGWNMVSGQVISDMTTELARLIGERANNTDLSKVKEYAL